MNPLLSLVSLGLLLALHFNQKTDQKPPLTWWTTHALEKVRPGDPIPRDLPREATLWSAQNEFEPFQIVLRAEQRDLAEVDISVSDLTGTSGSLAKNNVTVYFEAFTHLNVASSIEGETGDWPDALVPRVDRYVGERRNAFPMHLSPGRNQPLWIEIYVPRETAPGDYKGQVSILLNRAVYAAIPVTVHVWNFALPSTSSFKSTFGFNGVNALRQHFGKYTSDADLLRLVAMYQKSALLHRVSVHGGGMVPPRIGPDGGINWSRYDAEMGPFLDGTALGSGDPLPGARATTAELRMPPKLSEEQRQPYYGLWIRHFRQKGWLDRLFYYLWDEPAPDAFSNVAARGRAAHRADSGVRNLVTVALNQEMQGVVDIWTPLINCMATKPGFDAYCAQSAPRNAYQRELAAGKQLWWYQSCASHGCNITGGEYFRGWPSYMIDVPAVSNRIFQWLAWKYGIEGELYFSMNEAYGANATQSGDPWKDVYMFGGNGDGTLFYPGTPGHIGGAADIPVESIRLKLIREGLEDYEYLALCERSGLRDLAWKSVTTLATDVFQWDHRPESLYSARQKMGEALSSLKSRPALAQSSRRE